MRCASPPESVEERRSNVRYSSPTSFRKRSRSLISRRSLSAIQASCSVSCRSSKNLAASSTVKQQIWQMFLPLILTCCASIRSLTPLQLEQTEYRSEERRVGKEGRLQ